MSKRGGRFAVGMTHEDYFIHNMNSPTYSVDNLPPDMIAYWVVFADNRREAVAVLLKQLKARINELAE